MVSTLGIGCKFGVCVGVILGINGKANGQEHENEMEPGLLR